MSLHFLEFEKPIAELEAKIEELRLVNQGGEFDVSIEEEIINVMNLLEKYNIVALVIINLFLNFNSHIAIISLYL